MIPNVIEATNSAHFALSEERPARRLRACKDVYCIWAARVFSNEFADLSTNLVERLRAVDSHKVADLPFQAKERLTAFFKLLDSLFSLPGEENFCRRIQVDHQAWSGVKPFQDPLVHTPFKSPYIAVDPLEREVEQKMSIVQNDVPLRPIDPGQQLSRPFFGQEIDESTCRP